MIDGSPVPVKCIFYHWGNSHRFSMISTTQRAFPKARSASQVAAAILSRSRSSAVRRGPCAKTLTNPGRHFHRDFCQKPEISRGIRSGGEFCQRFANESVHLGRCPFVHNLSQATCLTAIALLRVDSGSTPAEETTLLNPTRSARLQRGMSPSMPVRGR